MYEDAATPGRRGRGSVMAPARGARGESISVPPCLMLHLSPWGLSQHPLWTSLSWWRIFTSQQVLELAVSTAHIDATSLTPREDEQEPPWTRAAGVRQKPETPLSHAHPWSADRPALFSIGSFWELASVKLPSGWCHGRTLNPCVNWSSKKWWVWRVTTMALRHNDTLFGPAHTRTRSSCLYHSCSFCSGKLLGPNRRMTGVRTGQYRSQGFYFLHITLYIVLFTWKRDRGQTSNVPSVKLNKCPTANLLAPLLTCVYPQVNLEVMRGAEGFATVGAVLGWRTQVALPMLGQRRLNGPWHLRHIFPEIWSVQKEEMTNGKYVELHF